jgi:hypothetical protein
MSRPDCEEGRRSANDGEEGAAKASKDAAASREGGWVGHRLVPLTLVRERPVYRSIDPQNGRSHRPSAFMGAPDTGRNSVNVRFMPL